MDPVLQELFDAIVNGKNKVVPDKVNAALEAGIPVATIVNEAMIDAMAEVGRRFECGDYFVPEMLIAARAMQTGMGVLKPYLAQSDIKSAGTVVIGTVKGDLHDIGKNLVSVMLEGAGFKIVDLGTDISAEKFVEAVRTIQPDILAMSALLTTTMPNIKTVIEALEAAGVRQQVKILVGGAPVTQSYADSIGADGYSPDASRAVGTAKALAGK
jgi:5-methyltetrahydrofolate--homocysteine methyltransferase